MESLDTTILNPPFPPSRTRLPSLPQHEGRPVQQHLSLAVFIPISGWLADRFGTRRVFSSAIPSSPGSCSAAVD